MYFLVRFDWNRIDSTRSFDRIVGCFDTLDAAKKAITNLPYDEFRDAVAIVHFPMNEIMACAEPDVVYVYNEDSCKYCETFEPYIVSQYFYM